MEPSTKTGKPWTLLWQTPKSSRSDAYRLETKLKNLSQGRILQFMLKYDSGIPNEPSKKTIPTIISAIVIILSSLPKEIVLLNN